MELMKGVMEIKSLQRVRIDKQTEEQSTESY